LRDWGFGCWDFWFPLPPLRIIIADDAPEFRKSVRAMIALERDIDVVAVARDGQEAVELAQKHKPDLILMDINMPRLDGLAAIRAVNQVSPNTVCMVVSSDSDNETLRRAMQAGVHEYLVKPFGPDELLEAIRRTTASIAESRQQVQAAAKAAENDRYKYLLQLVLTYLHEERFDQDAIKVYRDYAMHPEADLDLVARLAEVFLALRDWKTVRYIANRIDQENSSP
jgi:YesN/AraC family two-component response regulator